MWIKNALPRRMMIASMSIVLVVGTSVPFEPPSGAVASTCLAQGTNYFDGFYNDNAVSSPTYYEGASAYIVARKPTVCAAVDASLAWVMIGSGSGTCAYAQSGYMSGLNRDPGVENFGFWDFFQYQDCSRNSLDTYWSPSQQPVGAKNAYRVLFDTNCLCLDLTFNGGTFLVTPFNPFSDKNWAYPFTPQFFGEVTSIDDTMPGTPSAKASFSALGGQLVTNDKLVSMGCTMKSADSEPTLWAHQASSCLAFDIWQK